MCSIGAAGTPLLCVIRAPLGDCPVTISIKFRKPTALSRCATLRISLRITSKRVDLCLAAGTWFAILRIAKTFERDNQRKALVVMADWRRQDAHRDLAVRSAHALQLGQASVVPRRSRRTRESGGERFQATLPSAAPVNLVTEKDVGGRVYVSTFWSLPSSSPVLRQNVPEGVRE